VVREGVNKGKKFWGCSKPKEESCRFFEWADESVDRGDSSRDGDAMAEQPKKRPLATSTNVSAGVFLLVAYHLKRVFRDNSSRSFGLGRFLSRNQLFRDVPAGLKLFR
jgi:GRF zinc finger